MWVIRKKAIVILKGFLMNLSKIINYIIMIIFFIVISSNAQLVRQNITSVTIYEESSGVHKHIFQMNNNRLFENINKEGTTHYDFTTGTEFYDVYISDSTGCADSLGDYITIDCYFPYAFLNDEVGNNIDAIELSFSDGIKKYPTKITNIEPGYGLIEQPYIDSLGFNERAVGEPDGKSTRLGSFRSSMTLGDFKEPYVKGEFTQDNSTIALWHLNEGSGTIFYDATSNNNDGQMFSSTWENSGKFGTALYLDGIDDYASVEISTTMESFSTNNITIEMWIYLNDNNTDRKNVIWRYGTSADNCLSSAEIEYTDGVWKISAYYFPDDYPNTPYALGGRKLVSNAINPFQWYHLALTYNGKKERLFVNDELQDELSSSNALPITSGNFWLGKNGNSSNPHFFKGKIDEIRISNVARYDGENQQKDGWKYLGADMQWSNHYPFSSQKTTNNLLNEKFYVSDVDDGHILTGDVNGNGKLELIYANQSKLMIIDGQGEELLNSNSLFSNGMLTLISDVNNDGINDIGIGTEKSSNLTIKFYDSEGNVVRSFNKTGGSDSYIYPRAVLFNGKLIAENNAGYALNPRGWSIFDLNTSNELWYYDIGPNLNYSSIADVNGDGKFKICGRTATVHNGKSGSGFNGNGTTTTDGDMWDIVIDENGNEIFSKKYSSPSDGWARHRFVDFDGDGTFKILGEESHSINYYHGTSQLHIIDANTGDFLKSFDGFQDQFWYTSICDINNDGEKEIVTTNGGYNNQFKQYILDKDLNVLKNSSITGFIKATNDLTGNGDNEIILTNEDTLKITDNNFNLLHKIEDYCKIVSDMLTHTT